MEVNRFWEDLEVAKFVEIHKGLSVAELALKLHGKPHLPKEYILNQVNALQKLGNKLADWVGVPGLVFPNRVSFEQCSSSETAKYKSKIVPELNAVLDLTGGFGVDAYYLSSQSKQLVYVERQEELVQCFSHNMKLLEANNVEIYRSNSEEWLRAHAHKHFDLIYVDPARRGTHNEKLYRLQDCEPNILELLPLIYQISDQVLIKFSPMVDLSDLYRQLPDVKEVHVVSVKNECKEVLVYLKKGYVGQVRVVAVDLGRGKDQVFAFERDENAVGGLGSYTEPLKYIYEPNASLMKTQCFGILGQYYGMDKLAPHTHLFSSDSLIAEFPGRVFEVLDTCDYSEKALRKRFALEKANITTRNFGESVAEIRKKLKLKDGGHTYIYATSTVSRKKLLLICASVKE